MQGQTLSIDPTEARRRLDSWDAAERLFRARTGQALHLALLGLFIHFPLRRAAWLDPGVAAWVAWVLCVLLAVYVLYAGRCLYARAASTLPSGPSLVTSRAVLRMLADPDGGVPHESLEDEDVMPSLACDRRARVAERCQPLTLCLFLLGLGCGMMGLFLSDPRGVALGLSLMALAVLAYVVESRLVRRAREMVVLMLGDVSGLARLYGLDVRTTRREEMQAK